MYGQEVYKTPSGKKYHVATCRMVENVSKKITIDQAILKFGLQPCKICKPPKNSKGINSSYVANKAVGKAVTKQCIGYTKKGKQCKHRTSIGNGYCYQHTAQKNDSKASSKMLPLVNKKNKCGARTKTGSSCKRNVKGGGYCYQHS